MIHKHVRGLMCLVVISAVNESKTGKESKGSGQGSLPEKVQESTKGMCSRNILGNNTMQKEWPVQRLSGRDLCSVLRKQLGKRDGEEEWYMPCSLFPFYVHCLLREAHHYGRQNQYYQCQWLRVVKP